MVPKAIATMFMWATYLGMVAGLAGSLNNWVILLAFVLMIPLIAMTGMMWGMFKEDQDTSSDLKQQVALEEVEKRKRERLDAVLRDLSDEDLLRLKHRLAVGTIKEENLYANLIGDDGELTDYSS